MELDHITFIRAVQICAVVLSSDNLEIAVLYWQTGKNTEEATVSAEHAEEEIGWLKKNQRLSNLEMVWI